MKLSYVDGGGTLEVLISAATVTVININDDPAGLPTISGRLKQGQLLTANTQDISDADDLGVFICQWLRDAGEISGATNSTYMLVQADVAAFISVIVSYTDGIVDYLDAIQASNVLQQKTTISDQFLIQTEPGLKLSLGEIAFKADQGRSMVAQAELTDYSFGSNASEDGIANAGGYFDFTLSGLPVAGQSVQVVIPQLAQMPRSPVYRKLTATGWQDFVKNSNNSVASAIGEEGYCPPAGHAAYQHGLSEGHWCLQLTIEDGGPNDGDRIANNSVTDPGGVGQILTDVSVSSSSGGAWNPLLPVLSIFTILTLRSKKRRERKKQYENSFNGMAGSFISLLFSSCWQFYYWR